MYAWTTIHFLPFAWYLRMYQSDIVYLKDLFCYPGSNTAASSGTPSRNRFGWRRRQWVLCVYTRVLSVLGRAAAAAAAAVCGRAECLIDVRGQRPTPARRLRTFARPERQTCTVRVRVLCWGEKIAGFSFINSAVDGPCTETRRNRGGGSDKEKEWNEASERERGLEANGNDNVIIIKYSPSLINPTIHLSVS